MTKDSQDWLDTLLGNLVCEAEIAGSHLSDLSNEAIATYKSKIRKHILQEALEMIGPTYGEVVRKSKTVPIQAYMDGYDDSIEQLRNKFNDKYKED